MHIAFHIGANCTDQERLLKSVLRNASALLAQGIVVPGPSKYRRLLRETIEGLDGRSPKPGTRDILLDAIIEEDSVSRLVLANDNFIAIPKRIFDNAMFYPQVELKVGTLCRLFPDDEITFFIGMRHPAAFLQEVAHRAEVVQLRDFLGQLSPLDLRWSDVIGRIRQFAPQARVVTWCNEDTPLIWEDLIRLLSGADPQTEIVGQLDIAAQVLTPEALATLKSALAQDPQMDRIARHEVIAATIETHAKPDAMEDEVRYPELGDRLIAAMTEIYEEDLDLIDTMEGVELVLPFR
ncbi:hypothetical protein [Yoonia sp.]|uniref:hypothetical protein n=1 Tax=Yoonia sp. TaxID=2212373 RepID=UPI002FDB21D1